MPEAKAYRKTSCSWAVVHLALVALMGACGGASAPAEPPPSSPPALGPLAFMVPSGARLVAVARPQALWEAPATRRVVHALVPPQDIDALAQRTGIDLRRVERVVFAHYPEGYLVVAQGGLQAEPAVRRAAARMAPVEVQADTPHLRRGGLVGTRWRELVALRPDALVLASGRVGQPLAALLARAHTGDWPPGAGPALGGAVPRSLHAAWRDAALGVHVPAPLALPPGHDVSLLLARQRALTVAVGPRGPDELRLSVDLRGAFPEGAERNFRALAQALATSDMGGALGLDEALPSLRIAAQGERVVLRMRVDAPTAADGIGLLLGTRDHLPWGLAPGQM